MLKEVKSASNFLVEIIKQNNNAEVSDEKLQRFREKVYECLCSHYKDHWFPDSPLKGSGYRCVRINGKMDPLIAQAGALIGLAASFLHSLFPSELTMWVDPREVSYRIGENGSICVIYEQKPPEPLVVQTGSPKKAPAASSPPLTPVFSAAIHDSLFSPPSKHHQILLSLAAGQHHHHATPLHLSPPLSPASSFSILSAKQEAVNCKESLRDALTRGFPMERLFVSS